LLDSGKAGGGGVRGKRERGQAVRCVLACAMELALQILLSDFEITQGHADVFVSQQLHESGEADAETEHLSGITVPAMLHEA
jgi:hypothetical protein